MYRSDKISFVLSFGIVLVVLFLLASGINSIQFREGTLFKKEVLDELSRLLEQFSIYRGVFLLCITLIPLALVVISMMNQARSQMNPRSRRNGMIATLVQLCLWTLVFLLLRKKLVNGDFKLPSAPPIQAPNLPEISPGEAIPLHISPWLTFGIGFTILLVIVLGGWVILDRRRRTDNKTLEILSFEAQTALNNLDSGVDLRNVILRCYYDMTQTIEIRRGVKLANEMTPREFEIILEKMGFPMKPIQQLTRMFEAVRYGDKNLGGSAEAQARECLTAIVRACGD
jgi:hypothetical protein